MESTLPAELLSAGSSYRKRFLYIGLHALAAVFHATPAGVRTLLHHLYGERKETKADEVDSAEARGGDGGAWRMEDGERCGERKEMVLRL